MVYFNILILLAAGVLVLARKEHSINYYDSITYGQSVTYDQSPGQLFPKPQFLFQTETQHYLNAKAFSFEYRKSSFVCDLLANAFNRYYKIIFTPTEYETSRNVKKLKRKPNSQDSNTSRSFLKRLIVNVVQPCEEYPSLESDESCLIAL